MIADRIRLHGALPRTVIQLTWRPRVRTVDAILLFVDERGVSTALACVPNARIERCYGDSGRSPGPAVWLEGTCFDLATVAEATAANDWLDQIRLAPPDSTPAGASPPARLPEHQPAGVALPFPRT